MGGGLLRITEFMAVEMERDLERGGFKEAKFCQQTGGELMSLGKLSEGEIAFQSFPGTVHHHIVDHKIMGNNASSCCDSANLSLA